LSAAVVVLLHLAVPAVFTPLPSQQAAAALADFSQPSWAADALASRVQPVPALAAAAVLSQLTCAGAFDACTALYAGQPFAAASAAELHISGGHQSQSAFPCASIAPKAAAFTTVDPAAPGATIADLIMLLWTFFALAEVVPELFAQQDEDAAADFAASSHAMATLASPAPARAAANPNAATVPITNRLRVIIESSRMGVGEFSSL
jgi:hypothetical protein